MSKLRWFAAGLLGGALLLGLAYADRSDLPYLVLTGYSRQDLEKLSFLPESELRERIGLREVPGGFTGEKAYRGRAAHAIASYLGTRRWGPDVTLAFGYLKEYVPALCGRDEADPSDIAANYAGVTYALDELARASR